MERSVVRSGQVALILLAFLFGAALPALCDQTLDVTKGNQDDLVSYGGRGYAVRYSVPRSAPNWWAISVNIHGEAYGSGVGISDFFTISFMDMAGKVYARSEHPITLFDSQPEWKTVRITPTELPAEFWVVVDFKANEQKGVFIGSANTGGGQSMLADENCKLSPIVEEDGTKRPIDWCISVRTRNKYKGKMVRYDPDAPPLNKIEVETTGAEEKTQETDHFKFVYTKLDDMWGVSVTKLLETARQGLSERFGLAFPETITVVAGMDASRQTAVAVRDAALIDWNVKARNELLPIHRGGCYEHILSFCRELARLGLRHTLTDCRLMPDGMEEGIAAYLGGEIVRYVDTRCGQKLWPIQFTYLRQEGPGQVKEWVDEAPDGAAQRHTALFLTLDGLVNRERHGAALKSLFEKGLSVREFMKALSEETGTIAGIAMPDGLFPEEFIEPAFVWLFEKPEFERTATYRGLRAKRYKSGVLLSYDDNKSETMIPLEEGFTFMCHTPPGTWSLRSMRLFAKRTEDADGEPAGKGGTLRFGFLKTDLLSPLGVVDVSLDKIKAGKAGWKTFDCSGEFPLAGPFLIHVTIDEPSAGAVEIGCDTSGGGGHCFRLVPGSHADAETGHDWMVRLVLESAKEMDRKELDLVLREFRKALSD